MSHPLTNAFEQPGGSDFTDVTQLFVAAAAEMQREELVFPDTFGLQDSMTAFELGEVRMDSGALGPVDPDAPPFDPLAPLLPAEVCWLLDRSFACEIEWHHGITLSQSVYTLLHAHRLDALNPETIRLYATDYAHYVPPERPIELLTIVLRAAVFGLLKCCDAAWRELSKNRVFDGEDWQGEKCEVSLLEGVPFTTTSHMLERALQWVQQTPKVPEPYRGAIAARLALRKVLLDLLLATPSHTSSFIDMVHFAREQLQHIKTTPMPEPAANSAVRAALDPHVLRNLHTFVPLTPRTLRSQDATWEAIENWLDGWVEIGLLTAEDDLVAWEAVGTLHAWRPGKPASAYLRSLTQTSLDAAFLAYGRRPPQWLADTFLRPLGITSTDLYQALAASPQHPVDGEDMYEAFGLLGRRDVSDPSGKPLAALIRTMTLQSRTLWRNPARRRRALMRLLPNWLGLQDSLGVLAGQLVGLHNALPNVELLPRLAEHTFLESIREVTLSGFALELYSADERPSAYWYASKVMSADYDTLDILLGVAANTIERDELVFQRSLVHAMSTFCQAFFMITSETLSPHSDRLRLRLNFERRHKWVDRVTNPQEETVWPDFDDFEASLRLLRESTDAHRSPLDLLRDGTDRLKRLASHPVQGASGPWAAQRQTFLASLISTMDTSGDSSALVWDTARNPWFPVSP